MDRPTLKKSLKTIFKIEPFYTGGRILFTPDEKKLLCVCSDEVKLLDAVSGQVIQTFPGVILGLCSASFVKLVLGR